MKRISHGKWVPATCWIDLFPSRSFKNLVSETRKTVLHEVDEKLELLTHPLRGNPTFYPVSSKLGGTTRVMDSLRRDKVLRLAFEAAAPI